MQSIRAFVDERTREGVGEPLGARGLVDLDVTWTTLVSATGVASIERSSSRGLVCSPSLSRARTATGSLVTSRATVATSRVGSLDSSSRPSPSVDESRGSGLTLRSASAS